MSLAQGTVPIAAFLVAALAVAAALHALLNKRDPKSALSWIAVCLMFPVAGPVAYSLFGVNRIRTRAKRLHRRRSRHDGPPIEGEVVSRSDSNAVRLVPAELATLARISAAITDRPLVGDNQVELLACGEAAYPAMLEAIRNARRSVYLSTYIFDTDETGRRFLYALKDAVARGVEVRVLVDGVGSLYSWPRAVEALRQLGVKVERFLPPRLVPPALHVNLRNHRKILTADGEVAFTGGMNLGGHHLAAAGAIASIDLHFRFTGPIVLQLEQVFREDWWFVSGERLPATPSPDESDAGSALCRAVIDGPNEDLDKLLAILVGAISAARRRVEIMTPYFLPPRELSAALQAAALRGVEVSVLLPAKNNLPYVHWATRNFLPELLERGVRVFYQPPPFVHTKLLAVDRHYVQVGSANLDPRSLRLNFEIAVEVYDAVFAERIGSHFDRARERSREVTTEELASRVWPAKIRDAAAWLFTPYL